MGNRRQYKILIFTDLEYGGVVTALINLLKQLNRQRFTVTILTPYPYGPRYDEVSQYADIQPFPLTSFEAWLSSSPHSSSIFKKFLNYATRLALRKILKILDGGRLTLRYEMALHRFKRSITADKYDLVLDFLGYGRIFTVASTYVTCKRRATWIHDSDISFMHPIEKYYQRFDKIFCVSKSAADCVCRQYPKLSSKVEVLYNVLDVQKIRSDATSPISEERYSGPKIILTIARLTTQKGIDIAIEAAEILKRDGFEFTWFVLGEGSEREKYEQLITEKKLEDFFILLGYAQNTSKYLQHCDVYVQPSRHEGYGLAIAEARILNKVIVASDLPAIREQIQDGETGLLCKATPDQIAAKIQELFYNDSLSIHIQKSINKKVNDYSSGISKIIELCE